MYQITDGTFAEARRYCIHNHLVVEDGPWHDPRSCWFNALYTRVVPSDAVEMTAALLDRTVARTLESNRIAGTSLKQRQDLAAVIHLCGAGVGNAYARGGFRIRGDQRCGDQNVHRYLAQVNLLKRQFVRLAATLKLGQRCCSMNVLALSHPESLQLYLSEISHNGYL
jgi:hypothetical protein